MKKFLCALLAAVFMLLSFSACGELKDPPEIGFLVAEQFTGYKLGNVKGLVPEDIITDNIDSPDLVNFTSVEDGLSSLLNKKIHGLVLPALYITNELEKNDYDYLEISQTFIERKVCALSLGTSDFILPVDAALTLMENNGTSQKIANAHSAYAEASEPYERPVRSENPGKRTITIGICSDELYPFSYRNDKGELVGINVDVAHEIAADLSAELVIKEYAKKDLCPALEAKEIDLALADFFPSEDAPIDTKFLYSHPYYDNSISILLRSPMADVPRPAAE